MSFIKDLEDVVEEVSTWAANTTLEILDAITKGGPPFGLLDSTDEEKRITYLKLRGNPQAWEMYIDGKTRDFINELTQNGVPEADIATIKPLEIVLGHIYKWSAEMEKQFGEIDGVRN